MFSGACFQSLGFVSGLALRVREDIKEILRQMASDLQIALSSCRIEDEILPSKSPGGVESLVSCGAMWFGRQRLRQVGRIHPAVAATVSQP